MPARRPLDLEVTSDQALPVASTRYDHLHLLVRVGGEPIGSLDVPNHQTDLGVASLRELATGVYGREIWAELASQEWLAPDPAPTAAPISVVVCTRDRPERLEGCLAALAVQRHPDHEVIVVDNAPRDDRTREVAARFDVRYVVEPRPGLDWARNRGLAEARSEIVVYTDDDAVADSGWLDAIAAGFCAPEVGAVTGLVAPAELDTQPQVLFEDVYGGMRKGYETRVISPRTARQYRPHQYGVGCNMAFRRSLLERLGGFDPALDAGTATRGGGDLDAFQRVAESGAAVVYRPDALVRHAHRRTEAGLRGQIADNGRGYCAVLCAALGRTRGRRRLRVVRAYWRWMLGWHVRRIARRVRRRERLPMRFLLAELRGALVGPYWYRVARRRARRLAREGP